MTRGRRGWAAYAALLPMLTISLTLTARRADWAQLWPVWRPMILDLLLVMAGASLIAAVAGGVHAWREATRIDHA